MTGSLGAKAPLRHVTPHGATLDCTRGIMTHQPEEEPEVAFSPELEQEKPRRQQQQSQQGGDPSTPAAPAPPAAAAAGFSRWLRAERAKSDTFGFCLSLVFHAVTLSKWRTLPAGHLAYFLAYTAATAAALAWQRSGRPSYAAWRDWIQAAIRLDVFLTPLRVELWEQSVHSPPPSIPGHPELSTLLALPVTVANTMAVHLLMLPFAHPLSLWPHILVQAACAGRVLYGCAVLEACEQPFFQHPTVQWAMCEGYQQLQMLTLLAFSPLPAHWLSRRPPQYCCVVAGWLQAVVGFGVSVASRAVLDARAYKVYLRQQRLQQGAGTQAPVPASSMTLYDRVCDGLSARFLVLLAVACQSRLLWLLFAAAVWEAMGVVFA